MHPDKILRREYMTPVGLSSCALAEALHVPLEKVRPVLESKRSISAEIAVLRSVYFGTTDSYWVTLQAHYDLEVAKERMRERAARIIPHAKLRPCYSRSFQHPHMDGSRRQETFPCCGQMPFIGAARFPSLLPTVYCESTVPSATADDKICAYETAYGACRVSYWIWLG